MSEYAQAFLLGPDYFLKLLYLSCCCLWFSEVWRDPSLRFVLLSPGRVSGGLPHQLTELSTEALSLLIELPAF